MPLNVRDDALRQRGLVRHDVVGQRVLEQQARELEGGASIDDGDTHPDGPGGPGTGPSHTFNDLRVLPADLLADETSRVRAFLRQLKRQQRQLLLLHVDRSAGQDVAAATAAAAADAATRCLTAAAPSLKKPPC